MKQLLEKILTIQCNNSLSLCFHSLIFLFLKLGSQSKDWLFFYLCPNRNVKALSRKVERHKSID